LQDDRRAVREQPYQLVVAHLVGDPGADAARRGEGPISEGAAVLGDPEEWRPQAALGDELIDRIGIEQVGERPGQVCGRSQQRLLTPVLGAEPVTPSAVFFSCVTKPRR
jgi:hypothetical protein